MDYNKRLYTKESDGTISVWYLFAWYGPRFAVTPNRNGKLRDYRKYFYIDDIGKTIFLTRKEAKES